VFNILTKKQLTADSQVFFLFVVCYYKNISRIFCTYYSDAYLNMNQYKINPRFHIMSYISIS